MYLFESEIEDGFKKNICLICKKPNCKHLQEWGIKTSRTGIILKKKTYYRKSFKKKKPLTEPQWKKLLKSKQKSIIEKEFWESVLVVIPYGNKPEIITQLPFKHKYRPKGWIPFYSQGIIDKGVIITEIKKIPWKKIGERWYDKRKNIY